ncbi:CYFA0S05e00100g1_1 [Cyberlindnera fabianii]|uniref:CYFA0S05e00100g1_1 n=1 Tax=Cyberlindnera fabianii TaxID=36022 RepID=A0A061AYB1_CYBFA|nr:CYFA0S05e00100g1_1 [Cyberlindnera fabianii]
MSCTEAFDQLTSCYSVGGQVKHYYRYGHMNDCVKQLERFQFCLFNSDPVKIQQWYKKELDEKRARGSSEDIWELR